MRTMRRTMTLGLTLLLALSLGACSLGVNEDVEVPDGAEHGGGTTVNGKVYVGSDARVTGNLRTVNGKISVEDGAQVEDLNTVNGRVDLYDDVAVRSVEVVNGGIRAGRNLRASGDLGSVNGSIELEHGSEVEGEVRTVNGEIVLYDTEVFGSVENFNGGMRILEGSVLHRGLTVREPEGDYRNERIPRIIIGEGVKVLGPMTFERSVSLYIHESAEVGDIRGAEPERYSGEVPRRRDEDELD